MEQDSWRASPSTALPGSPKVVLPGQGAGKPESDGTSGRDSWSSAATGIAVVWPHKGSLREIEFPRGKGPIQDHWNRTSLAVHTLRGGNT